MNKLILILFMIVGTALSEEMTFEDQARTASFVWKCELALGMSPPFSQQASSDQQEKRIHFLLQWLQEDIDKMSESKTGQNQKSKMISYCSKISLLIEPVNSDREDLPSDATELANLLTQGLRKIAKNAELTLSIDSENSDNNPRQ